MRPFLTVWPKWLTLLQTSSPAGSPAATWMTGPGHALSLSQNWASKSPAESPAATWMMDPGHALSLSRNRASKILKLSETEILCITPWKQADPWISRSSKQEEPLISQNPKINRSLWDVPLPEPPKLSLWLPSCASVSGVNQDNPWAGHPGSQRDTCSLIDLQPLTR